jgi:acetyltransferase-like isoleucine patch superfamily enzyme
MKPDQCKHKPISIIVATRNAEASLNATLNSIKSQTDINFEVLLIDGASSDRTVSVARESGLTFAHMISEPDKGIADAWNKGIRASSGDWICFLNSGDLLHPKHFERAANYIGESPPPTLLFCDVLKFGPNGITSHLIKGEKPSRAKLLRGGVGFGHPGSIASRSLFKILGEFDPKFRIGMDTDFILRAMAANVVFNRFDSVAYMVTGGVSDIRFAQSMREFYGSAVRCHLLSKRQAAISQHSLPYLRTVFRAIRGIKPLGRWIKHTCIASLNVAAALFPFCTIRNFYFKCLGFSIGRRASIGMGFRFYRLGKVTIGDGTVVNRDCLFDNRDEIAIGCNVSIARGVQIFTAGHDTHSPLFEMTTAPVCIGDRAVIFARCTIMPGVTIGKGAVVHAGSTVTKDVDAMTIVAGIPARQTGVRLCEPIYALDYTYPLAM